MILVTEATGDVDKHARRIVYLSSEGVGGDLEHQTDTITAQIAAELAA